MIVELEKALKLLIAGDVVAIPTETVYGLAARIDSETGIAKIFSVKERPFFDPLIVHVADLEQAKSLAKSWNQICTVLVEEFWPGPLTLVVEKSERVSAMISSGLTTVGIRMPKHPVALALIARLGIPVAAPSANKFGRTSPTRAEHVLTEFSPTEVAVLDGGSCQVGIESTILRISGAPENKLTLLRQGMISLNEIIKVLKKHQVNFAVSSNSSQEISPGSLKHHYMPKIPLIIVKGKKVTDESLKQKILFKLHLAPQVVEGVQIQHPTKLDHVLTLNLPVEAALAARELYHLLRQLGESNADAIILPWQDRFDQPDWQPIMDRLSRAASLVLYGGQ